MSASSDPTNEVATQSGVGLSPYLVGLAICIFFPLGLYLLWNHPTLASNRRWWIAASLWSLFAAFTYVAGPPPSGSERSEATTSSEGQADWSPNVSVPTPSPAGRSSAGAEADSITAVALWNMASNEAQMKSRFQKPIKVTGPVFEVKNKYGEWHVRLMTHEIARGVDGWIECVMTSDKGLSSLSQGASATVEGTYDKGTGSVVHLRKCKLICP